jgi:hypothetical protein
MIELRRLPLPLLAFGLLFGCETAADETPQVVVAREALSPCSETVPANRNIDGIPAYAQCASTQNSAIFSNNGVDTSTTRTASDWVETQFSGGFQCTELAHRYLYFKWQVKWIPNGNAGEWCDTTPPASSGVVQSTSAVHGDLMVLAPGSCGADTTYGHVNVIDVVDATGKKLTAVEQNSAGRNMYMASCAKCFLHVVANNGMAAPAAGASAAGAQAPKAGSGVAGSMALAPPPPAAGVGAGLPVSLPAGRAAPPVTPAVVTPPLAGAGMPSAGLAAPPPTAAGSGGSSAPLTTAGAPAIVIPIEGRDAASGQAGGCSVMRPASRAGWPRHSALFGLALLGLFARRRWQRQVAGNSKPRT